MNLKQTMRFPSETPGQKKMKGKAPGGEAHLESIFFSPPEPKTYRENKPSRLHWVPEADRHALTQCWAGSKLGTST